MPVRLAACDPCRTSKVACDHIRPTCTRCNEANRGDQCVYRDRPFKRQRVRPPHQFEPSTELEVQEAFQVRSPTRTSTSGRLYPNPGYLGKSSHATIFNQLPSSERRNSISYRQDSSRRSIADQFGEHEILEGAKLLDRASSTVSISACKKLLESWTASGVNLALAGQFTMPCARATANLLIANPVDYAQVSKDLFSWTCLPLAPHTCEDIDEFIASSCGAEPRWEALGLFFTAVSRAMTDLSCFRPLYNNRGERRSLQQRVMLLADRCLEISLSLDCLNDLQLILQYENFISHSFVDGDQSYHTWRKLGDVISTILALGYHENIGSETDTPAYLRHLRRAAFARAYSADKNVAIFLGRPPRMHRDVCRIAIGPSGSSQQLVGHQWDLSVLPEENFDYMTETLWSAVCAWLKGRILDLRREHDDGERLRLAVSVKTDANAQWQSLPARFRLKSPLRLCDRQSTERDFTVSARLNFLHVLFLAQISLTPRIYTPDSELINISAAMLSLEVEALILKDHLAFSGTSIGWRVAYYGLPAAGILCFALLHRPLYIERAGASLSKVKQDLRILVAYVEMGALVHPDQPNFALLNGATETIKNLLENLAEALQTNHAEISTPDMDGFDWTPWILEPASFDFELDFWNNLSEHPALVGSDTAATGMETLV